MLFAGVFDLPWWGLVLVVLALTHVTIVAVTVFLHRCQAHRALDLHPVASHFFRFWLWLTTGMVTREWAAIHRKHHAKCETADDPHSPQVYGINRVLWGGVFLYVRESHNRETIQRYGHGTPDDWIERSIYTRFAAMGIVLMGLTDLIFFGIIPGAIILIVQLAWIPFWAAGVINGVGHWFGYRSWQTSDASTNICPWGILIGGEELHNNHHAFATSAKLSAKWYEFDIGWFYIRMMQALGLARVKKVAPTPRFSAPKPAIDQETLAAIITHRYDVLARYTQSVKAAYRTEMRELHHNDARMLKNLRRWLHRDEDSIPESKRRELAQVLDSNKALHTLVTMRKELTALWARSTESSEQLLKQLQDWCQRAEASGIVPLQQFASRLRCYA